MSEGSYDIVMSVDHGFTIPLAVALASMAASNSPGSLTVHILHPGLQEATRSKIARAAEGLRVSWIQVDPEDLRDAYFSDFLSNATLYRLLLGELLPADVKRVLYVDADILVLDSLAAVFDVDLQGRTIAAVRDAVSPWAAGPWGAAWRELGLDPSSSYFNAGVLLIDVHAWRRERIGTRSLELLREFAPQWGDQDALNTILEGEWVELPRRWNLQTGELTGYTPGWALWRAEVEAAIENPAIVHFTGREKPWDVGAEHPRTAEWLAWLEKTPWPQWRPVESTPGAVERALRSAARRYRALRRPRGSRFPD